MIKISEIISKPVISLYDCESLGFINNAYFDINNKKLKFLSVLNEENELEYLVENKNIINLCNDAIIIKNKNEIELKSNFDLQLEQYSPLINLNCYNENGSFIGNINEVFLNKNLKINSVVINKKEVKMNEIKKINNVAICSNKKIDFSKYEDKKEFLKPNTNYKVEIQSYEPKLPSKAIINETMLLNRIIYKDIIDLHNNLIIKANTIITNKIIEIAKSKNLLKELIKFSF